MQHTARYGKIEVVGQLRANGSTVREAATAAGGGSVGELLERAANESLSRCAEVLLRGQNNGSSHRAQFGASNPRQAIGD